MPDIRVTCPACKTQLEIGAEFEGQEVECGTCLEVFTATTKKAKPKSDDADDKPAGKSGSGGKIKGSTSKTRSSRDRDDDDDDDDDRPARRRRDDDDDDDDYDHDHGPSRRKAGGNGLAVASLVLGILSILCLIGSCVPTVLACCCGLGTVGLSIAAIITGALGMKTQEGKGMATTGLTLGIVSLIGIIIVLIIGFAIVGGGMANPPGNAPNNNKFR